MWTKKNDHAPKSEGVDFFQHMPEKGSFGPKKEKEKEKKSLTIILSSFGLYLVFTSC